MENDIDSAITNVIKVPLRHKAGSQLLSLLCQLSVVKKLNMVI